MLSKKIIIAVSLLFLLLIWGRCYALKIPEPYVFNIYFESNSATPAIDYILKFDSIRDAIKLKKPVRIDIEGFVAGGEDVELSARRAAYIERWLKSVNINAVYTVRSASEGVRTARYVDPDKARRVAITVYDQRIIYAMQDAERITRARALKKPVAHIVGIVHSFGSVIEGQSVDYEFNIRNVGDADLEVLKVKPD